MKPQAVIAHTQVLATSVVGAILAAITTYIGQGHPDPTTQAGVALVFGAFTWVASLVHRWQSSPADVEHDVVDKVRRLMPLVAEFVQTIQAASSSSSSTTRATPVDGMRPGSGP